MVGRRTAKCRLASRLKMNAQRRQCPSPGGWGVSDLGHLLELLLPLMSGAAVPLELEHPTLTALPGRGISSWTYRTGVTFKNNLFGWAQGKMLMFWWRVLHWRLMIPTATRFTGNILIVGCECLEKENVLVWKIFWCSSVQVKLWAITAQDNSEAAFISDELTVSFCTHLCRFAPWH